MRLNCRMKWPWLEGGEKMSGLAVQIENLTMSYGAVKAVAGISFDVRAGEISVALKRGIIHL